MVRLEDAERVHAMTDCFIGTKETSIDRHEFFDLQFVTLSNIMLRVCDHTDDVLHRTLSQLTNINIYVASVPIAYDQTRDESAGLPLLEALE